jgi:hypothetical protein
LVTGGADVLPDALPRDGTSTPPGLNRLARPLHPPDEN